DLHPAREDRDRVGAMIGSALGGVAFAESQIERFRAEGPRGLDPALALAVFPGAASCNIAIEFGFTGPNSTNAMSCASGTIAVGEAFHAIREDRADVMLAGGAEAHRAPTAARPPARCSSPSPTPAWHPWRLATSTPTGRRRRSTTRRRPRRSSRSSATTPTGSVSAAPRATTATPSARAGRSKRRSARSPWSGAGFPPRSISSIPTRPATWTACAATAERQRRRWCSPTPSGSAASTPRWCCDVPIDVDSPRPTTSRTSFMPKLLRPLTAEFIGTLLFVFLGASSVVAVAANGPTAGGIGSLGVALAHGVGMAVIVSMTMSISGGHMNPAVTFGLWIANRVAGTLAWQYILAQVLGGVAGAAL